jgi:hypothetical protein
MNLILLGDLWLIDAGEVLMPDMSDETPSLCIANLETPVCPDNASPRPKSGPALKGNFSTLSLVRKYFDRLCLTLANNHTLDYGEAGLRETLGACERLDIATVGAGSSSQEAHAPLILELDGMRIGVLGCCETQFGIATPWRAGVAAMNPTIHATIRKLSSEVDIVIVSIHGAAECCPWPSPQWQDLLRSFVDAGAKIVHGHHAHIPQGYEEYNGGFVFCSLGNFLVDPEHWDTHTHPNTLWSVVPDCRFHANELSCSIRTLVIEKSNSSISVRFGTDAESQKHSAYLSKCNLPLENRILLTGIWQEAAMRMYDLWYADCVGFHSTRLKRQRSAARTRLSALRRGMREAIFGPRPPTREEETLWYHVFSCETHRDVISTALGVLSGELDDLRTDETRCLADEMMPWSVESVTLMKWPDENGLREWLAEE